MHRRSQAGFTLVEVILVMAISSLLVLAAWQGQAGLRAQAQFDEGVNRVVTAIADARNEAVAGINTGGAGNGAIKCVGPANPYVLAGTMVSFDSSAGGSGVTLHFYEADEPAAGVVGSKACEVTSAVRDISVGVSDFQVSLTQPSTTQGAVMYIRGANSVLNICYSKNLTQSQLENAFAAAGCVGPQIGTVDTLVGGKMDIKLKDSLGHQAHILIDQSGLPTRSS
jgi:prepilin-type N-terminal cleavage/methylation domain-containing protein